MDLNYYNPFSKFFLKSRLASEDDMEEQYIKNSQGISQEDLEFDMLYGRQSSQGFGIVNTQAIFKTIFTSKQQKIAIYREMANFPEIKDSIDTICDEAITANENGQYIGLQINEEIPLREEQIIRRTFNYVVNDVFKFKERGWDLFKRWLIESELYLEVILDKGGTKIIGVKPLPAAITNPVYEGNVIKKYIQTSIPGSRNSEQKGDRFFETNQVLYINSGEYGTSYLDVRGYLESTIRTYNQLRSLEDALIIYRIVRAPERRLWNIEVGKLQSGRAEEFLKGVIQKYRKQDIYNASTGTIDNTKMYQALTQDYWFTKKEGQGTEVTPLQSSMTFGELDDVKYFLTKLYKTLHIPRSRWEDTINTVSTGTAPGEITREEVKFSRFVGRLRTRFSKIIIDLLVQQLRLSNQVSAKYTQKSLFNVEYFEENVFAEQKKLQILKAKSDALSGFLDQMATTENLQGVWSRRFVMKEIWGMTDEEYQKMRTEISEELKEAEMKDAVGSEESAPKKESGKIESPEDAKEATSEVPEQEPKAETPDEVADTTEPEEDIPDRP